MTTLDRATRVASAPPSLELSRDFCRQLTRREARNFYYGLKLLPEPKRSAMYALYAYMRLVDDIADDNSHADMPQRNRALDRWHERTLLAIDSANGIAESPGDNDSPLWPAFIDLIRRYRLPASVFEEMIAGQRDDVTSVTIPSFPALRDYCYRVASVVGVASLYVFGIENPDPATRGPDAQTLQMAIDRGIAFQLTNILRDLREDSARGRCYLPADELARFHVTPGRIALGEAGMSPDFLALMQFQIDRARQFYAESAPLEARIHADARPTLRAMTEIYRGILEKIARRPARVLRRRVRLSAAEKLFIGWRALRAK